jgi:glycosyltransferase involved in cell wall biosynthesis
MSGPATGRDTLLAPLARVTRSVRILLVSDFFPPTPGGMESHVRRLAEALIDRGHEIAVVTGTYCPDPLPGGAIVEFSPTILSRVPWVFEDGARQYLSPFPDPVFSRAVRRVAESWQADIIHAHGWCAFSSYWPDAPPLVVTLHDHGLRCPKRTLLRGKAECSRGRGMRCMTCRGDQATAKRIPLAAMMGWSVSHLMAHTGRFIAVSHSVAERVTEIGLPASQITIIANFIDTGSEMPADGPSTPIALYVGPDGHHKGRSVAIEAFTRLPPGTATLVLVGSSTAVNIDGVSNLGYLRGAALWEQYRRASVALVPSVWPEPCPTVALEAMAFGLPVIGSRIGGIPDLVEHGRSGLLVPPNNPARLAESMHAVLTDHELRGRLSQGARTRSRQFDTAAVVPQIIEVYESLL